MSRRFLEVGPQERLRCERRVAHIALVLDGGNTSWYGDWRRSWAGHRDNRLARGGRHVRVLLGVSMLGSRGLGREPPSTRIAMIHSARWSETATSMRTKSTSESEANRTITRRTPCMPCGKRDVCGSQSVQHCAVSHVLKILGRKAGVP